MGKVLYVGRGLAELALVEVHTRMLRRIPRHMSLRKSTEDRRYESGTSGCYMPGLVTSLAELAPPTIQSADAAAAVSGAPVGENAVAAATAVENSAKTEECIVAVAAAIVYITGVAG